MRLFHANTSSLECVSCDYRNDCWALVLYCVGCDWREIRIHEDISQTRCVTSSFLIPLEPEFHVWPAVTFGGAALFLLFGVIYLYEAFAMSTDIDMSIPISPDDSTPGI